VAVLFQCFWYDVILKIKLRAYLVTKESHLFEREICRLQRCGRVKQSVEASLPDPFERRIARHILTTATNIE